MDFKTLLKSLEEVLCEVMVWLVFYPLPQWQVIRHHRSELDRRSREFRLPSPS